MTEIEALTARVAVLEMLVNQLLDGLKWRDKDETMRVRLARTAGAKDRVGRVDTSATEKKGGWWR